MQPTANPQNSGLGTNGTISFQSDGLRFATQGTMSGSQFAGGGMKVMTLPADSNGHVGAVNFYSHFNLFAWAGSYGPNRNPQILFTDINDKLVAGYGIVKSDMSGNSAKCSFWVGGNTPKEYTSFDLKQTMPKKSKIS